MMLSDDVIAVVRLLEQSGCGVVVDGGWGVDALLGCQTRPHADLDLAIALADVAVAMDLLRTGLGYAVTQDEMPTRLELGAARNRRIDLHPLVFDEHGNGWQQLPAGRRGMYLASGLQGSGSIGGHRVRCLSPDLQLRFHLGYDPDDDDRRDVEALCRHFGLVLPAMYRQPG
jgi:lincosamide nucleotidyltransferase A/C/D/E